MPSINARRECSLVIIVLSLNLHNSYQAPQNDLSTAEKGEKCFTPSNDVGTCVPMENCQSLLDLEHKSKFQPRAAYYVERSSCQTNQTKHLKCCPNKELKNKQVTNQIPVSNRSSVSFPEGSQDKNGNFASSTNLPITSSSKSTNSTTIDERMKLLPTDCGRREVAPLIKKVIGGEPAILGEYPWIVALGFRNQFIADAVPAWNCGGSLITPKHVLTAAHCVYNRNNMVMFVARVGELNLDESKQDGATPEDIPIQNVIVHTNYDRRIVASSFANDIALVVLERSAKLSRNVKTICLPVLSENRNQLFEDQESLIAGWGAREFKGPGTSELLRAELPVISNAKCKADYSIKNVVINDEVICAGIDAGGVDSCQGDSGGPLMAELNGRFNLLGIVSYGDGCGKANSPGIYTRTTAYLDWILKTIAESP